MNINLKICERKKVLLNCLLYNELMMLEDRITFPSTDQEQRELILEEINDIKDMLEQIKGIKE